MDKNKAIIVGSIIVVVTIIVAFYILNSGKTISPISSKVQENQTLVSLEKQHSKTLKEYSDNAGFSFQYPQDVQVSKKDTANDSAVYASLEITSIKTKGVISIKVLDTNIKSIGDWFLENKLIAVKEIKIGEVSGKEVNINNKIIAAALDQGVLFTIEVDSQNQKYWVDVYQTILSSFNFVPQQTSPSVSLDSSSDDVVLEEEIVE